MRSGLTWANGRPGAAAAAGSNHRARAIVVGGLFVFAIVVLFVGEALYSPVLDSADDPGAAHTRRAQVVVGILIEFMAVPAVIMIAATLFPVLRRHAESLALAYVGVRILEGAILTVSYVAQLSRLRLSQSAVNRTASPNLSMTSYARSMTGRGPPGCCTWSPSPSDH